MKLLWNRIPRFAKMIIPLQTLFNLLLSFWIYQEYLHNAYFRIYVSSYFQGSSLASIILISNGALTIVAIVLYTKLRSYRRELGVILSTATFRPIEEGLVNRWIRELKDILSRLFGKPHRS